MPSSTKSGSSRASRPTPSGPRSRRGGAVAHTPADIEEEVARRRNRITTLDGAIMRVDCMSAEVIADNIELFVPLIKPNGCGPLAHAEYIKLGTFDLITEMCNETRYNEQGLALGHRTIKRLYQQSVRDISRYQHASEDLKRAADAAGIRGVPYVFVGRGTRDDDTGKAAYPIIREAPKDTQPDGMLRAPKYAVQKNFEYLNDKFWHRYLLPFGCFFVERPQEKHQGWKDWLLGMRSPASNKDIVINPYSVTAADMLYLANTSGWIPRLYFTLYVLRWAMEDYKVNLLQYHRNSTCSTDAAFRMFVSLERHMHLFGCIHMLRSVITQHQVQNPGYWTETIRKLDKVMAQCCTLFGTDQDAFGGDFNNMIVTNRPSNLSTLSQVFPKCARIKDAAARP